MLELIIAVLPGTLAFFIYRLLHKKKQDSDRKTMLLYIISYTIITNLCILIGLKLIGMQKFNLWEMSARFKIKWIALELAITLIMSIVFFNLRHISLSVCRRILTRIFPVMLFLIITYAVFTPSSLFLENIDEFMISYHQILPILLAVSFLLAAGLSILSICIANEKILHIFIAFFFGLTLSFYIQGNFLNPKFPTLDGAKIDWSLYGRETVISVSFWLLCMVVCLTLVCLKKDKTEKAIKYISYFLSAVQAASLIVLLLTVKADDTANYGYAKDGEFSIGSQENVIIFIVDALQAYKLEEYLVSDAYADGFLNDFTFFDNVTSGGAPTHYALPVFLFGMEYDPMQPRDSFLQDIREETALYDEFHDNGYDVRFYTTTKSLLTFPENAVDNYTITGSQWIGDYPDFGFQLYKLTNFYLMPQFVKQYFWSSGTELLNDIASADTRYQLDDAQFYSDFQASGCLSADYEKAFRLYHLWGIHLPCMIDAQAKPGNDGEDAALQGDMKIIREYIEQLKMTNTYDTSAIIILGDHGLHESNNIEDNPGVLIKLPHETQDTLTYNSAPVHFRNLTAAIAGCIMDDYSSYGPSVYDISTESDVERLHTIDETIRGRVTINEPYDHSLDDLRLITYGQSGNGEYEVWNPHEINRIDYSIGDMIDFTADNEYGDGINYRLYKENGAATASNELSVCFALTNYKKGDIMLHFTYSNLYNDSQKIRLYANGNKVENIVCTRDDMGKEMTVVIPKEDITDNELIIRMVFPNAVTPNQLDRSNPDMRILSVAFDSMWLTQ
ncbi:MAG: hypothetical protein NC321_02300 [Clostridium sp.]|nr:hypothetical protein [Clostridium sp.]